MDLMPMKKNIIIEGVDRLGKDTLISGLQHALGHFQVVHYQKPLELDALKGDLQSYQLASFHKMFEMLGLGGMLMNRGHLGEIVYAPRYRGYSGDYVYQLEQLYPLSRRKTLLVLLYASSWGPITDDGLSFDFSKKDEEQRDFIQAFTNSHIEEKLMIDVTYNDQFRPREAILNEVLDSYRC